ncbi:MAG: C_GCAxxG_C_C family protein [Anaerolineaceae bacterium]|nr:MAG: C_GCAxxG_C_C family protein [Anaerolineaceae bacterium]
MNTTKNTHDFSHERLKNERVEKAIKLFDSGFNCSQAVIGVFCTKYGMDEELAMKLACGFGGGMRCGEVCGAVSGAVMAIGLRYGQYKAEDKESKARCYELTSKFMDEYVKRNGSVLCRDILGYDVRDTEARAKFPGKQEEVCPNAIKTAVLLLEDMNF